MQLAENVVIADRFRLSRLIGQGGMGSVWQARDLRLDTDCAIKFIEGELAKMTEAHRRFEREAKAAAQVRSPHLVQIIDHNVWEGTPYIAMELLEGEDLGKRIARTGRMTPAAIHAVMVQACRGLSKAHAAGIVHRDIKPDNLFIVNDDEREIVKILDFGIAKQSTSLDGGSNTKTGAMLGTPYFMSPEQAQGIKTIDHRSDLWSLGVIVFQAITGCLPFESEALGDLLVRIIVNPIPVPSQVASGVPAGFDRWWAKAAAREPENRFQSAKEFVESLSVALGLSVGVSGTERPAAFSSTQALPPGPTSSPSWSGATPFPGGPAGYGSAPQLPHAPSSSSLALATSGGPSFPGLGSHAGPGSMQTFSGTDVPAGLPRSKSSLPLVGALVGAVVLIGVIAVGVVVMRRSAVPTTASASSGTTASPPSAGTASASATHADPLTSASASADPPTVASVGGGPSPIDSAPKAGAHASGGTGKSNTPRPASTGGASASAKPASGAKPKPADLGF